jgi:HK97 family phage prohead protease
MSKFRPYEIKSTQGVAGVVKDVDTKGRTVTGYFAKFGNIDSDSDIIIAGAAKKTIQENGPDSARPRIKHLWQHDTWQPLATPKVLKEDDFGIYFESTIANTTLGNDVLTLYEEGVITEHSIGFNVIDADKSETTGIRTIKEIRLWEGSSVTWGANSDTPMLGIKSLMGDDTERLSKKLKSIRRILWSEAISDETGYLLDLWLNQMETALKALEPASADMLKAAGVEVQSPVTPIEPAITLDQIKGAMQGVITRKALEMSINKKTGNYGN